MTPIGHLLTSYITGKSIKNISLPVIIIGGVLPDIDFFFIFFDWFNQVHRVITHNLVFITSVSLIGSFFVVKSQRKIAGLSLFLGGFLHLLIDSIMDNNPSNGIGIALFWPFYNELFCPFNLFFNVAENKAGWNEPIKMLKTLIPGMLYEVPFYIISLFLLFKKEKT